MTDTSHIAAARAVQQYAARAASRYGPRHPLAHALLAAAATAVARAWETGHWVRDLHPRPHRHERRST
ncbi:hypothetical protein [Streptomyces radiopugnans]|uniref:hypothetical protein n=1 Tax=Streptomyces radiopugnans TaxID=403935 RepID=UPI003F1A7CCD